MGIGVNIVQRSGNIIVVSPVKGSPAEAAGILPNDIIVSANGIDLSSASVDYAQSVIAGEEGTVVTIGILRAGKILTFDIKRAKIKDTSVTSEIIDGVGYLYVSSFNGNTVSETEAALKGFDIDGNIMNGHALFIYQLPFGKRRRVFWEIHGGAGITYFHNIKFHFAHNIESKQLNTMSLSYDAGTSLMIYLNKRLFMELGGDYVFTQNKDLPMGEVLPYAGIGWQF